VRVAWVSHRDRFHPLAGGVERSIAEIGRRLAGLGDEVHWLSIGKPAGPEEQVDHGMHLKRFGPGPLAGHVEVLRHVAKQRYDIIIDDLGHAIPWGTNWITDRPTVAFFHHLHRRTLRGQLPPVLAFLAAGAECAYPVIYPDARFVTESRSSLEDLTSLGIRQSNVEMIPPGVDGGLFRPRTKNPRPTVVYFGGLKRYKRPGLALEAFAMFQTERPNAQMFVVGRGPVESELRGLVTRWRLADSVRFMGRLTDQELADLVGSAWANIHTAVAEGWCLTGFEAAAAGVPTVACDVPGLRDSVIPGVSGLLVAHDSAADLAAALESVTAQPSDWVARCRKYAEDYSWDTSAERWHSLLHEFESR